MVLLKIILRYFQKYEYYFWFLIRMKSFLYIHIRFHISRKSIINKKETFATTI